MVWCICVCLCVRRAQSGAG